MMHPAMAETARRGSDFDGFRKEEGVLAEVEILALKRLGEAGEARIFLTCSNGMMAALESSVPTGFGATMETWCACSA